MSNAALHVARTGLDAQNTKMRVIANNLANVNTTGFKRDRADFETLAYQQMIAVAPIRTAKTSSQPASTLAPACRCRGRARSTRRAR